MLCEDSGYTYKFKIYTGKDDVTPPQGVFSVSEKLLLTSSNLCLTKATIYMLIIGTQL